MNSAVSPQALTGAAGRRPEAAPAKILLVDDLNANLVALDGLLQRDDVVLFRALSGEQALELLLAHDFALAIVDVQMPGMSGFELAALMRGTARTRHIPIIFVTAGTQTQQHRFQGYEAGAVDFLFKPIEPDVLRAKASIFLELFANRQELARQRDELRAAHDRLRFMAESMPQKIFTAKPDGTWDYTNEKWAEFTGVPAGLLHGWNWARAIHPDDLDQSLRQWRHAITTGEPFETEHRLRRNDGAFSWHLSRAQGMRGPDGAIALWIGSSTDIHAQKATEGELRQLNTDLSYFAFAASHDLQEPLRMVGCYADLLLRSNRGQFDARAEEFAGNIRHGISRMHDLLNDLLAYTQVSREEQRALARCSLQAALAAALLNLRSDLEASQARVEYGALPEVAGREIHFVQLFQNLISNSLRYRSAVPPHITVNAVRQGVEWHIAVADNGIGIAPQHHQRVFGVFKRLHGKEIPGTGIGLAICQRVIDRHGGRIWVESDLGQGATFHFTLPVLDEASSGAVRETTSFLSD